MLTMYLIGVVIVWLLAMLLTFMFAGSVRLTWYLLFTALFWPLWIAIWAVMGTAPVS